MLEKLKEVLRTKREFLRKSLDDDDSSGDERHKTTGDIVDIASGYSETEIIFQLAEVGSKELAEVERAFRRIEQGTYGSCEACGKDIPIARLKALPFAAKCVPCQEAEEKARQDGVYFDDDSVT